MTISIMYDWNDSIPKFRNDISEYLKKRYDDYCNHSGEREGYISFKRDGVEERHEHKKSKLIELGLVLREKLEFFLPESRNELFENTIKNNIITEKFFKSKFDKFIGELDKEYIRHKQNLETRQEYINNEIAMKLHLLKKCENMKDNRFIESIDKRKAMTKKWMLEEDKRIAEEKIVRERKERRQGFSNIKPLSFYEEKYKHDEENDNEDWIKLLQQKDIYFQEHEIPDEDCVLSERPEIYITIDTPEENQKHLNRCKELKEIIEDLISQIYTHFKWLQNENLFNVDILQEYLTKGYLVTTQIVGLLFRINFWLICILSSDLNKPYLIIDDHPSKGYNFNLFTDDYDITKIKEDIKEFVRVSEEKIFTPYECLKVYLKKHNNKITKKQYAKFTGKSLYVASKELERFEAEKKLKSKVEDRGLNVFYV